MVFPEKDQPAHEGKGGRAEARLWRAGGSRGTPRVAGTWEEGTNRGGTGMAQGRERTP